MEAHQPQYHPSDTKAVTMDVSAHIDTMKTEGPVSAGDQLHTPEELATSRRINRKMDLFLLPFLSLLYLFNGLDRSNIGNAQTQGE